MDEALQRTVEDTSAWSDQARCNDPDVDLSVWFPKKGAEAAEQVQAAKKVCWGDGEDQLPCPVIHECAEYAITTNQRFGIWGGLTEQERAKIRRNRRRLARERGTIVRGKRL